MRYDEATIAARVATVAASKHGLPPETARDVAFHLTDWLDDLDRFERFCADPDGSSDQEALDLLLAFLIHVPNHLTAAGKLLADLTVSDIFGVGAVEPGEADGL